MTRPNEPPSAEPIADPPSGDAGRDRRGRFARGNTASLKHGKFSRAVAQALLPEQVELLQQLQAHEAELLVDLGGADALSRFERDLVERYEQLGRIADFNAARMLASKLAVRREAHSAFMTAIGAQLKIVGILGHRRRQKDVGAMTASEYQKFIEQEEANNAAHSPQDHGETEKTNETD